MKYAQQKYQGDVIHNDMFIMLSLGHNMYLDVHVLLNRVCIARFRDGYSWSRCHHIPVDNERSV